MIESIYIADDSNTDRMILEAILKKLGYKVTSFATGTAVFDAIQLISEPIIILLDWLMPDRSGIDICMELVKRPPPGLIYIIIATSRSDKSDIAYALENGADDFITKPFDKTELRARINAGIRLLTFHEHLIASNQRLITYTKKIEQLADSRAQQLLHADRLSTIGVLSAGIAHEINNPTSFVSINIQTLEENFPLLTELSTNSSTDEQKQKALNFIAIMPEIFNEMKNGVARIRNIVNGLKIYAHVPTKEHKWFSVDECIESALLFCSNRLKGFSSIKKELSKLPQIFGNQDQLEQVLVNLFTNAVDAIEDTKKKGTLAISTKLEDEKVIISVHDNGPGVPKDKLDEIFMPFFTTKPIGKGTGLGLSISKNIISDHQGELLVSNNPDGGAVFKIILPVKQEDRK